MLVGTDVCVPVVFVWEETGVPWGNTPVWLSDHMTISHAAVYKSPIYINVVSTFKSVCTLLSVL